MSNFRVLMKALEDYVIFMYLIFNTKTLVLNLNVKAPVGQDMKPTPSDQTLVPVPCDIWVWFPSH